MAWTAPYLFVVNTITTAAILNTYVSDNLQWLKDNRFDSTNFGVAPLSANASGNLTLTTSYQDVAGATVTLGGTGEYVIVGVLEYLTDPGVGFRSMQGQLMIDAVGQSGLIQLTLPADVAAMGGNVWKYTAASASLVAKLRAKITGAFAFDLVMATNSMILAWQVKAP